MLFCVHHACGVRNLKTHLRDYHTGSMATKKAVVQRYAGLRITAPKEVRVPPPMHEPFAVLGRPKKAYVCDEEDCPFVSVSRDAVRMHCNRHGWRWSRTQPRHWHEGWAQCFFPTGGFQQYFIVDYSESSEHEEPDSDRDAAFAGWDAALQTHEEEQEVIAEDVAKQDKTLWWKKTSWQEHLAKSNLRHLSAATRLPSKDDGELAKLADLTQELIEKCVRGLTSLDNELRRWLRSAQASEPDLRPMARLQNAESQARYASYLTRFLTYSMRVLQSQEGRTVAAEEAEASSNEAEGSALLVDTMKDARRLYPWHGEQRRHATALLDALAGESKDTQLEAMQRFLQSVLRQTVRGRKFESPMLHFLAVFSIDEESGRLREANDFSYMLAGIVYCVRVLMVEDILPAASRDVQSAEDDAAFLKLRRKHLADGGFSPMSKMLSLLAYGKYIALNHQNGGSLFWDGDEVALFRGRRIVIADFRTMIDTIISRAEDLLWSELMWTSSGGRFTLALDDLVDDVTLSRRGFSFLDDPANRLTDTRRQMWEKMQAHPDGRKMRQDGQWRLRAVRKYLRAVDRFRELLLFCIHLTGGQPGRGTEVTAIRFKNGFLQDRNVFVIRGQMVVVTRYHKSQSQFDKPKVIPRFLPWRVGQLLGIYLAYVVEMAQFLRIEIGGVGFSEHLWEGEGGVWETDRLTKVLKQHTQEHLGTSLTTLEYRHVAIFIGRKVVGEGFARGFNEGAEEVEEAEVEEDDPLEMSAGRGAAVGANRYSVSIDIIKHLSSRTLEVFRPLSEGWHAFLGLQSRSKKRRREDDVAEEGFEQAAARNGIHNFGRAMKRLRAGVMTPPTSSPQARPSSWASDGCLSHVPSSDGVEMDVHRVVSEEEVKRAMSRVLGQEDVDFRSEEQRESLMSVVNVAGRTPLVVVLPTGGGKSMLFMVSASLEDPGVTVVVVPFRALLNNLLERANTRGIDCAEWMSSSTPRATLIFISADKVSGTGFVGHMKQWERQGVLRRIFLDEAHLAFKDNHWRPKLAGLRELRQAGCPLIMLTGTLPPALEPELEGCMAAQFARYVRCSTVRHRTRYMVEQVSHGAMQARVEDLGRRMHEQLRLKGKRGIIFCKSRDQCEGLANALGLPFFMGQLTENPERLAHWLQHNGLIIATSALGAGIDFDGIVFVLHVDIPYGIIDFAQESGRAGRAGEDVDSLIVCEQGRADRLYREAQNEDQRSMAGFVRTQGCRRRVIGLALDGAEVSCSRGSLAHCDNCGEGITALEREYKQEAHERRLFGELMDEFVDCCARCWLQAPGDCGRWAHSACTDQDWDGFREQLRFDKDTHSCFKCGLSQRLCRTGQDSQQKCQWPGRAGPLLYGLVDAEVELHLLRDMGYEGPGNDRAACISWLGRRHPRRIWGEVMSNAMAALIQAATRSSLPSTRVRSPAALLQAVSQTVSQIREDTAEVSSLIGDEWRSSPPVITQGEDTEQVSVRPSIEVDKSSDFGSDFDEEVDVATGDASSVLERAYPGDIDRGALERDVFKSLLLTWQGRCSICLVSGADARGHQWRDCPRTEAKARMTELCATIGRLRYEYSACFRCHAPQAMCESWRRRPVGNRARYDRVVGASCQFMNVVQDMGAAIWAVQGEHGVHAWVEQQMATSGKAYESGLPGVWDWCRAQFIEDGIEVSGLCRVLWQFGPREVAVVDMRRLST